MKRAAGDNNLGVRRGATGALLLASSVAMLNNAACESNKNHEARNAFAASLPNDKPEGCLGQCLPDPGSPLVNCAAEEEGLEFLDVLVFDTGVAPNMYTYTDRSIHNLTPHGWEPMATRLYRCINGAADYGLHIQGGPYRDWGGGMGTRLDWKLWDMANKDGKSCANDDPGNRAEYCPPLGEDYPFNRYTFDLTEWEGISLWARRGPNGQPLLRVMIGDKRTDDDISFLSYEAQALDPDGSYPRYCERYLDCGCELGMDCLDAFGAEENSSRPYLASESDIPESVQGDPIKVCWKEEKGTPLSYNDWTYQYCDDYLCSRPYDAFPDYPSDFPFEVPDDPVRPDPQFFGRTCNTFAFRGGIVDKFCFNPGEDPDPPEANELCGDHWAYPIYLSTEWKFYKIPFTRLLQQGWAKEQPKLELDAASMLRMTWDKGYVDYWIDDVRFYRKERPEGAGGAPGD